MGLIIDPNSTVIKEYTEQDYVDNILPTFDPLPEIEFMISNKQIFNTLKEQGLPLFTNGSKNYNLNLIGVRVLDDNSNKFNDLMIVMWFYGGEWKQT